MLQELLDKDYDNQSLDERELAKIVQIKRFAERWTGDADFRQQMLIDPYGAIARYNLQVEPREVRPIWNPESCSQEPSDLLSASPVLQHLLEIVSEQKQLMIEMQENFDNNFVKDPHIKTWRMRQLARLKSQIVRRSHGQYGHIPLAFELTKGCSVGCWFCHVAASRLSSIFTYNQENAKLWREVLELMRDKFGASATEGLCYWATDPLDNPDYEKFSLDFYEILGAFPPTTTAQPLKDPARTRSLLQLSKEKGCETIRFSILSLEMLNQVHQEFTPEELSFVHLVLMNKESARPNKVNAGRARQRKKKDPKVSNQFLDNITAACITGFLFSLTDRNVKLISPCLPDERWPFGYRIHSEGTFSDVDDLERLIETMIADHMPLTVSSKDRLRFRPDLKYESLPDGFQLSTRLKTFKFRHTPYVQQLGEFIRQGDKTAGEIAGLLEVLGLPLANTFRYLNQLFERDLLDDEPQLPDLDKDIHK
jgi:radical SAM family RiPP maturation amino acid epimerase